MQRSNFSRIDKKYDRLKRKTKKKRNAERAGTIFFAPFGMILGMFVGAIVGELIAGKENSMALKAGLVAFVGSITATFIKLSSSLVMAFYFFTYLFKG